MAAFLDDLSPFQGTGERNEDDLTLEEYLKDYNPYQWKTPSVTADILVFKHNGRLFDVKSGMKILMVRRKNHPCIGELALPGGFVNIDEDIDAAAKRELCEETGVSDLEIEKINVWGEADRDPRGRIITVSYMSVIDGGSFRNRNIESSIKAGDDAAEAFFMDVSLVLRGRAVKDERLTELYGLTLTNTQLNIKVSGIVERSSSINEILLNEEYHVISKDGIAFDHARFIVQALVLIRQRLRNR